MPRLFVLDAMGLAYRAYYAFISRPLINSRKENTSAIFGFANTVLKIRREEKPDHWALAWDGPGPTWRHERFPDYKAQRKPTPEDLLAQLEPIETLAQALGLPVLEIPGMEADDVMATLAARGAREGLEVVLVTGDKDMLQVVGGPVRVLVPQSREAYEWMDADAVRAKWGVGPEHIRDMLALMGDASDNIPGVPGVGEKTARELMRALRLARRALRRLAEVTKPALKRKLEDEPRAGLPLARAGHGARPTSTCPSRGRTCAARPIRREALLEFAKRYEIRRLENVAQDLGTLDEQAGPLAPARPAERRGTVSETPAEGVKLAAPKPRAASAAAPRSPPPPLPVAPPRRAGHARPVGLGRDRRGRGRGGPARGLDARAARGARPRPARAGAAAAVGRAAAAPGAAGGPGAGGARRHRLLRAAGARLRPQPAAGAGARLAGAGAGRSDGAQGGARPQGGEPRAGARRAPARTGSTSTCTSPRSCAIPTATTRCARWRATSSARRSRRSGPRSARGRPRPETTTLAPLAIRPAALASVRSLWRLAEALRAQLESREQWALYRRVDLPLVPVLLEMERTGIALDRAVLAEMSARAGEDIARLEEALYVLADERVNLNSGPQVARVLFEKLKLKTGRRTKTGFSTDSGVLEELAGAHAFPKLLLEYRALAKLKSTYLDALPAVADLAPIGEKPDGRVHTTFHQAVAATGRLSSSDPNLQNIPFRTPQGRAIRRAFVAPPGRLLVGADYSQIELRVMAHLSGDPALIEAFRAGEDVHASTARRIFNVTGELDPALRARAKVVNFGVMYGMGARSLAQQMGIGLAEAEDFIGHYFGVYAGVRAYLDRTVEEARERGWVRDAAGPPPLPARAGQRERRRALAGRARGHQHAHPGHGRRPDEAGDAAPWTAP